MLISIQRRYQNGSKFHFSFLLINLSSNTLKACHFIKYKMTITTFQFLFSCLFRFYSLAKINILCSKRFIILFLKSNKNKFKLSQNKHQSIISLMMARYYQNIFAYTPLPLHTMNNTIYYYIQHPLAIDCWTDSPY